MYRCLKIIKHKKNERIINMKITKTHMGIIWVDLYGNFLVKESNQ